MEQNEKLRIRKLTPRTCGRLQGVKDEDITKMSEHLSDMQLYHCFGDSICISVLMAIFGQLCNVEWVDKVNKQLEEIKEYEERQLEENEN